MQVETIGKSVQRLRGVFRSGRTRPIAWRRQQLEGLRRLLREREAEISAALTADLGRPALESFSSEIGFLLLEIEHALGELASWLKPEPVSTPLLLQPASSWIQKEPLGVVLIIAPWNYPFGLALGPLIGALAAGNCAIVKPSEISAASSATMARLVPQYLDPQAVLVVEGGVPETSALLAEPLDHVFYTGSGGVGRVVMAAAARHLTPVTLELGGKSPCIVDERVDVRVAAKRIAWGKFFNAGQTCVAPDYLLVHDRVLEPLLGALTDSVRAFYGADPQASPDYARIVSERHFHRLVGLLGDGKLVVGGQSDAQARYLAPTILRDVALDSAVMADEIFGPILPVLGVRHVDEAIELVNERPKPLALYLFSNDRTVQEQVLARTSSGGASINHAWLHIATPRLPFGGVGASGMGSYHGRASFDTFTHRKSVLRKSTAVEFPPLYPPYSASQAAWLKRLL